MTRPTVIYFGPDGSRHGIDPKHRKVFIRALLYSTGKRGQIIENMFVTLRRGETRQNFNIWVYGDDELKRGSGLYVPQDGVATNHHFLPPPDVESFIFSQGDYSLEVFATLVGSTKFRSLFVAHLNITQESASYLKDSRAGLYFDWGPDSARYSHHIKSPPPSTAPSTPSANLP